MADQLTESQLSEFKGNFLCAFSDMYIYEQKVAGERRRTKKRDKDGVIFASEQASYQEILGS